jgi:hypothetical protein
MRAWVVEPSNAWSNLAYVIVGLVILTRARRDPVQGLIAVASILIGFGSFGLHGTGTRWGELADVGAMYLMSGLGIIYAARRLSPMTSGELLASYVAIVGASIALMIALHNNGIFMFAGQITATVLAEVYLWQSGRRPQSYRWQQAMIASFTAAFLVWNLDKWGVLCQPDNHLVTGHAVWHALTAVAVYCFARHEAQNLGARDRAG